MYQGNPHSGQPKLKGAPHGSDTIRSGERLCATRPVEWYNEAMVTLLPIEPRNEAHGALIIEAFNKLFINRGGDADGWGDGDAGGYGDNGGWDYGGGDGTGMGYGDRNGNGNGDGNGDGSGWAIGGSLPEEWLVK